MKTKGLPNPGHSTEEQANANNQTIYQSLNSLLYKELAIVFLSLIFAVFFTASTVSAQNIPPGQDAGAQSERFQKETEQKKEELEKKKVKAPEIEFKEKEEAPKAKGPSFVLKEIKITGTTVFRPEDFFVFWQPYIGKEISFSELEAIAEKIRAEYKQKGYLTTIVYIPEQEIKDGQVEIRVAEGKMGDLKIEGNKWFSSSLIEKFFHLKKNEILNVVKMQKDILRLNQNPDLELKVIVNAGKQTVTSDITLKAKENFPFHIGVGSDNQGTRLTGKFRTSFSLRASNLTGNFDTLFMNNVFTYKSSGESLSYTIPLDTYGTKFSLDLLYFKMRLGKEYKPYEITGVTRICTPQVSKELFLSDDFQARGSLGLQIKSVKKKSEGNTTASDQLREPYFGFDFTKNDSWGGQINFSPKFTFGTSNFLGASQRNHPTASREGTGGFFFKYEQGLSRLQRMPFDSYMSIRTQLQATSHTLSSSDQFQLGGANSIRGYPEGDYLADNGASINFDWFFPCHWSPRTGN